MCKTRRKQGQEAAAATTRIQKETTCRSWTTNKTEFQTLDDLRIKHMQLPFAVAAVARTATVQFGVP